MNTAQLLEKLAERFDAITEESNVPDRLKSVQPERLEAYLAGGSGVKERLTLTGKDGTPTVDKPRFTHSAAACA